MNAVYKMCLGWGIRVVKYSLYLINPKAQFVITGHN